METRADVRLQLTGREYRLLCHEMEYHRDALKHAYEEIERGPDRQAAMQRFAEFDMLREKIAG